MTNNTSDFITIGKIVGVHGIKGTLKLLSFAESLAVFEPGNHILLKTPGASEIFYKIEWIKPHGQVALLCLKGIINRDMAESLTGSACLMEKNSLPELEEDTYYWTDLIGLSVFTSDDEYLGNLETIMPTGSNDVYVVKNKNNEILLPALASVIIAVDLENKTMRVNLPEGL